jgi:hypothetical protein
LSVTVVTGSAGLIGAEAVRKFATALAVASISYGIWQSWWLGSLGLAAAFAAATL